MPKYQVTLQNTRETRLKHGKAIISVKVDDALKGNIPAIIERAVKINLGKGYTAQVSEAHYLGFEGKIHVVSKYGDCAEYTASVIE